ncbi:unnamed protein product [Lepeophtheirus salmonis]|uniref:(salmon louse) hypothetical protein n=1 Tax=Lepeophtheirus salmonis TaxID=72036 RepID=A0A7R8CDX2_LEPSM|nr:unnamed protein product [Lepeophtheirus salmonis]CAF2790508.1 unnamed protein product [Lepeophtheirus salmonis]
MINRVSKKGWKYNQSPDENDADTIMSASDPGGSNLNDMLQGFNGMSSTSSLPREPPPNHFYNKNLKRKSDHIELPTLSKRIRRTEINPVLTNFIIEDKSMKKIH